MDYAISNGHKDIVGKLRNFSVKYNTFKSEAAKEDSDTWNDSPVSTPNKKPEKHLAKISEHFLHEENDNSEKSESDTSVKRSENASPQSGVIPPPCKPLRSLEYLQAGISSENRAPVQLLTLGTVRTRHISMTESEKSNTSNRYSYQGDLHQCQGGSGDNFHNCRPPDLLTCIGDEKPENGTLTGKHKGVINKECDSTIHSDWGSNDSLPLDEFCVSAKKEIKIVAVKDENSQFLQKQFSILEKYEKNHSRHCSVSRKQEQFDDIADFLEDNNRINCQLESYAHSDILVMAKKSRSLPRNCQGGSSYNAGSLSLPRTLDSGKDFIRDMKQYGSYRPKAHNVFKRNEVRASKKHGFIDKLKNMFGKKSQIHLTETQDNNAWLHKDKKSCDCDTRKTCSLRNPTYAPERHSYSERIRSNAGSVHSYASSRIEQDHPSR